MELTKEYIEQKYHGEKLDTREIAKLCGETQKKIWYFMVKNDIPRRSKKETGVVDLSGKKFGNLMVIRRAIEAEENKGTMWRCQCKCGNFKIVRGSSLSNGDVVSCGCKWKTASYERISGSFWWSVQKNAKKRGLVFDLDKKFMWDLFLVQNGKCALSGVEICFGEGLTRKGQTASIDRIDSAKGYVVGNVRWVHKVVNQMKWSVSDENFIKWIKCIANYQNL